MPKINLTQKFIFGVFFIILAGTLYYYFLGYDSSINWKILAEAHSEKFTPYFIVKGPFQFDITGYIYNIAESFSAEPIHRNFLADQVFLGLIFLGISLLLTTATFLPRYVFLSIGGLMVFFLFNLRLNELGIFGFSSENQYGTALLFIIYLLPAYLFHAIWKIPYAWRLIVFLILGGLSFFFSGINPILLTDHIISYGYFSFAVLSILFVFLIAEENIFAILYLVTKTKGGKNNEKHFVFFGFIYLGILGLHYAKKAGLLSLEVYFFDPYLLLTLSSVIALWSLQYKKDILEKYIDPAITKKLLLSLGITSLAFIAHSMFRGNDPVYEGIHYFILYAHLGFGVFFFFYVLLNFINPLISGLQVYKIVYRSQNFPYISAKLAGLATIAAFFFLADKGPYRLLQSGQYNYLGAEARISGNENLAIRYFEEGRVYGHDNHFSNYQLGHHHLNKKEIELANHRFYRATLRHPSAQAFINQSNMSKMLDQRTAAMVALKSGLNVFPDDGHLSNNLGLMFSKTGDLDSAKKYLGTQASTDSWNNALRSNYWIINDSFKIEESQKAFSTQSLPVKTNVMYQTLKQKQDASYSLDTSLITSSNRSLHKGAYLVNYSWMNKSGENSLKIRGYLDDPMNEELHRSAQHALAMNAYSNGHTKMALKILDELIFQNSGYWKGFFHNQKGMVALDQHALNLAKVEFESALELKHPEAEFNLMITLLEMGRYEEALDLMAIASIKEFRYKALGQEMTKIISGKDLTPEQLKSYAYYFYHKMDLNDLKMVISQCDTLFIRSFWDKVWVESLKNDSPKVDDYLDIFSQSLDSEKIHNHRTFLRLKNNEPLDTLAAQKLKEWAESNILNVPLVIEVAKYLSTPHDLSAYHMLLETMEHYPKNTALIKAYIEESLNQGLLQYAEDALNDLKPVMDSGAYQSYSSTVNNRIKEIRNQSF